MTTTPIDIIKNFTVEAASRSQEFEDQGFVSQDLAERIAATKLYRLCNKVEHGGLAGSPIDYAAVVEHMARFDASTAWVLFIGITSAISIPNLEPAVVDKIFADPLAITAGVFAPKGKAIPTTESGVPGFRLTGQWQWASGSRNAKFITGGGFVVDDSGKPRTLDNGIDQRGFVMPISDVTLLDTWHVAGLKGTGSTDYKVDNLFVPEYMTFDGLRRNPRSEPIYRFSTFGFLAIGIAAVALGIARAAIDELVSVAQEKKPQGSSRPLAARASTHIHVSRAEARLRSARAFAYQEITRCWSEAQQSETSVDAKRDLRLALTHAVESAKDVVSDMYLLAGGTSVYLRSPLQRYLRDVDVVTQHMMVSEPVMELTGRLFLQQESTNTDQL